MNKSRTDIDRIYDRGISDVERMTRKTLSEAEIAAAAAASKSGAGVFLRSHTKEILLCIASLVAICLITFAALRFSSPKPTEPQTEMTIITEDTIALATETPVTAVETVCTPSLRTDNPVTPSDNPKSGTTKPTSQVTSPTSQIESPTSNVSSLKSNVSTPNSPEPIVVKKTIVKRDTVVINETIILKDTTYVP